MIQHPDGTRTFDAADESTLTLRCKQCGRVRLLSQIRPTQREKIQRGATRVRCTPCITGHGRTLPGYHVGSAWNSTTAEAFPGTVARGAGEAKRHRASIGRLTVGGL